MLLGIAIGDAFGAGYEFVSGGVDAVEQSLDFESYASFRDADHFITPGMYTDDTQMSIAVAELLQSDDEFSPANLSERFVAYYRRDPINGYAGGFQKFLNSVKSGKEFIERIRPDSIRNGAAMRSVPLGLEADVDRVVRYAKINASLTHNTPKGIASSIAVALASYYFIYSEAEAVRVFDFIDPYIRQIDAESAGHFQNIRGMTALDPAIIYGGRPPVKGIPSDGILTAGAVLYLITTYSDLSALLKAAVLLGGDTDSVASIAMGIAAARYPLSGLPEFLFRDLTNHAYGRDYLLELGRRLQVKYFGSS